MFKSIRAYINRIRTSLFGRMERMKESSKRMAFERKRKTLRRFLRNGLRVENLEGRALMAVDMNVISSPMAITMNAANDTATISRLPAATPYPASLMVQTNTADPDQDPDVTGDETYTFIRTAGTGTDGITVSDVGSNAGQVLTIGGDLAISNPKGTDRAIASFTATGIETINLDQAINVSGSVSGNADTVNVDDPGKVAQAVSLVKAAGTVNIDAGAYSDGEVTVGKEGLTVAVSADVSGVSLKLGSGINNITLTGAGDMDVTGNSSDNTIVGNAGANEIDGGAGDDTLTGGLGNDTLTGGVGVDTAIFSGNYEDFAVAISGTTVTVTKTSSGEVDTLTGVEKVQFLDKDVLVVGSDLAYTTITAAVNAAEAGDVVLISAGTYNEALEIEKEIHLIGSGNGTDPTVDTIIDPTSNNSRGSQDGIWFGLDSDGSSIASLRITGATNGIQIQEASASNAVGSLTFKSVAVSGNTSYGVNFRNSVLGTTGMVTIEDSEFSDNSLVGIRFPSTGTFAGISVTGSTFENNGVQGFATLGGSVASVSISDSTFANNGTLAAPVAPSTVGLSQSGHGDLILNSFNGNATLTNLTISGDGTGSNGLQVTGPTNPNSGTEPDPRKAVVPIGTVSLSDITISGSYGRDVTLIGRYTDLFGLTISGLTIDATQGVNPGWAQFAMDNVGGDIDLADYGLESDDLRVRMSTNNGVDFASATDYTSGATLTGGSGSDGLLGYALGDTLSGLGGVDYLAGNAGDDTLIGGAGDDTIDGGTGTDTADFSGNFSDYTITFSNDGKVIVTGTDGADTVSNVEKLTFDDKTVWVVGSSVGSNLTTISAAVAAASDGHAILLAPGTYTENVTVNKALSILGPFANVVGTDNSRSAVAGTGEATIVGMFKVSSSGSVTISGLRFLNNASSGIGGPSNPALQRQAASAGGDHTYSNNIFYSTESAGDNTTGDRAISFEVLGSGSTTVSGNYITGNGTTSDKYGSARWNRGIWSDGGGSSSITISNNTIEYARSAMTIDVAGDATYTITNNTARISGTGISFGINAASSTGNITGMVVDNVDTDFNFQNLSQAVTFSLADALSGTVSENEVVVVLGGSAGDTLTGSSTVDYFTPNAGADTVNLADGNDFVTVSSGSHVTGDTLDGGDGSDTIYFTSNTASDTLVLPAGTSNFESALISSGTGATTGTTALSLDASAVTGALSIQGNDGDNTLKGGAGADTITANAGNDVIHGNAGNDTIDGGAGTDSAVFSGNYSDYTIAFSGSNVTVSGPDGSDTVTNVDKLTFADRSVYIVNGAGSTITTIGSAVTAASDGDVIMVAAGTYTETLTISKALSILGPFASVVGTDNSRSAVAGTGEATIVGMFKVSSSGSVTISGLRFLNNASSGIGGPSNPALQRQAASAGGVHTYSNNIFYSTESAGDNNTGDRAISFEVLGSGSTTVSGNYITGNGTTSDKYGSARWNRGIWSDGGGSSSITILNNTIEYARSAMTIDVAGDATYTITNNTARISGTGISFGINAASSTGNITGMVVDNVDTDFNFQNLSQAVTFSLATALSNTVPSTETVVVLGGSAGDTLTGSSTVDYFTPNAGADTVNLADGNDFVTVSSGSHVTGDSLDGGDGSDTIYFTSSTASDTLVLPAGTSNFESALISNGTGATTGTTALNLDASAVTGALSIQGNDGDNTLKGGAGADTITANAGNDVIHGNAGNDTIDGGAGTDSAVFSGNYSDYTIAFSGSNVTVNGPDGSDTVTNVDKLTFADRSVYIVNGAGSTITTISAAITAASAGDVVMVAAGTYSGLLSIPKSLTLRGANAGVAPTTGNSGESIVSRGSETIISHNGLYALSISADDVTIDGITITSSSGSRNITTTGASVKNLSIRNTILDVTNGGNTTAAIQLDANADYTGLTLEYNSITVRGTSWGLYFGGTTSNFASATISKNTFRTGGSAIFTARPTTDLVIDNNTFDGTIDSVANAGASSINGGELGNLQLTNNLFTDTSSYGAVVGVRGATISGNTFQRNVFYGLGIWGGEFNTTVSDNTTISGNSFSYNDFTTAQSYVGGIAFRQGDGGSRLGVDVATFNVTNNTFVDGGNSDSKPSYAIIQRSTNGVLSLNDQDNSFNSTVLSSDTPLSDMFTIADRIADSIDSPNLGAVNIRSGNQYVTPQSFTPLSGYVTTIADVQRAVTLAGSGSTVWVKTGAYAASSATTSVDNLTLNTEDGVTGFTGLVLDNSVTDGTATLAGAGDVNLTGNAGANTLTGNDGDNEITGGAGDDTIDGGAGSNTAVFSGNYSDYAITLGATVEVDGTDGTDSLTNIQFLKFDDITIPVEVVSTTATISAAAITYGSSATITVTIARESGTPLPGGTVSLVVGTADPIEAQLDADGVATFTVPGLAAGSHDLSATYAAQGIFGASSDTETLTVNTKTLTVSGAAATNRAYDGTLIVSVAGGTLVGIVDDDDVSLTSGGTGTGTMADKHVGTGKAVTVTGYTLTGAAASNYSIDQPTDVTVDISTKTLTVSDAVATDRVYNATTTVVVSGGSLEGIVDGDEVSLVSGGSGTGTMEDKNVGTDKSVTVTGYAIEGTGASNYSLTQPTEVTVDISAKTITVSGADATDRVYDATTTVSVSGGSLVGVETDDVVNLSASGTGEMTDKNVGTGKSVTVSGYSISGTDAANYSLDQPTGVDVDITAKTITVSGADATDRVYDATTTVSVSGGSLVGVETDDIVNLSASGTGTMTDKNVGTGKSVTVTGYSISGDDSGNYLLTQPTGVDVDITAKTLTVSGADATDRVYNATTTVDVSGGTLVGVESGDSVDLDNIGTGEMTDKNVGTGKSVTVSGYSISGTDAANYSLDQPTGVNVDISVKTITVSGTEATDRVYDATTAVSVSGGSLEGVESGDIVNLSDTDGTGAMADKNVGTGKSVTVSGYSISGTDAANYSLTQPTGVTVDISTKSLTGTFTADNKQYDGTTAATVLTRTANQISGDDVSLDGGTATFNNKNVGTAKTVSLAGATLSGADAANYTIGSVTDTTANVTAISLTGAFTVSATKVYDGNTSATVVTRTIPTGVLSGETVTLVGGTAAYSNRHVADGKTVSLSGASLGGVDSGNYILDSVTDTTANITKKDVTGSFTVDPRQYDGTNVAIVASTSITKENNDDVVLLNFIGEGDAATFNNAFVGNGKLVTPKSPVAGNWSLSGAEAGNYNLTAMNTTTANITKRTLTPTVTVNNRVYNGTTAATINTITSDKLELDDVTVTATSAAFNDKNVGVGKTATVSGLSLSGSSVSQYELASTTASATGTVTKAPLTLNFLVTATKVYDGTDTANITASNLTPPVFGDDAVGITGVVAKYDSKNVGANKPVTIADGYSLTGADAGNYEVTAFSPRTASITAKSLSVTSWAVDNKVYDGTNAATISSGTVFAGLVSGDTVTLGGTATFADKNAGDGKVVTLATPSLTGADGGNYSLSGSVGTVTANITKKTLTPVYSVVDKYFDGNNVASVTLQSDDRISGDVLTISYVSATFADSAIGANKDVTISTISVSGTDSGNYELNATSQTLTASINNNAPVVTTSSGNTPYGLGNVTVIDAAIAVADFESTYAVSQDPNSPLSLGGGSMTVSVTENQGPDDYLLISAQGSAAGQIDIDEGTSEVLYGGVVIGTYAGGYETPLVITFGSSATLESVQALARRIAFSNSNMETTIEARTVSFVVNDGIDSSDAATKSVTISASNQPPVLTPSAGSTNFTEGNGNTIAAPVRVDNSMTVSDTDQLNFDTGVLTVSLGATGTADDRLSIISSNSIGAINVSGSSVRIVTGVSPSLTAVEIGTFTGGTNGSDPLVVTLNAEATVARTQLLVRAVGFQNVSNAPSTADRLVSFQLSDGVGATSSPVTKTVTVTATNDLPVVVLSDSTPTFTEPTGPTTDVEALPVAELIDNGVSISDPDNPASFDGGNVTATIVSGGIATSDRFGIRQIGGITVSGADAGVESVNAVATATVSHDGVVFGTISLPTNAVRITFNSEATLERVEALARALTVRNTSDLPGGNRLLRVQVTDNASGTSAFVTKTVTVVSTNDIPRIAGAATTSLNLPRTASSATNALGGGVTSFVDSFADGVPSDMNGGTLTASMKKDGNSSANVQLSIIAGTGITLSGNDIIHTSSSVATTFGTITSAHPASGGDLTITFNANANATRITALLKQLRVRAVSGATTGGHVLTVTLTEPDTDTVSITRPFNVT